MQLRTIAQYFLIFGLWTLCISPSKAASLNDVRVGLYGETTRLVIESDATFAYRVFQLSNPARLIIDLPNMQWAVAALPQGSESPLIKQSRHGLFRPDVLRLVLDLHDGVALSGVKQYQNAQGEWLLLLNMAKPDAKNPVTTLPIEKGWRAHLDAQKQTAKQTTTQSTEEIATGVIAAPRRKNPTNKPPKKIIVMIDPGHGGLDPGAIGNKTIFEKDIVLQVGKQLQRHLNALGFRALLTRDADFYIPLGERYRLAQEKQAQLFVSIHADAAENPKANGASIYTLSEKASDREAAKLAKKENASDILVGVTGFEEYDTSVQQILLSMSQRATQFSSAQLAKSLLKKLSKATNVKSHAHRSAGFAVLKSPSVPSVLVELGYMSNNGDRKKLLDPKHRDRLGAALAAGIVEYFATQKRNNDG